VHRRDAVSLVLVVDDDPATREVIASVMREGGHQVVSADAAETALELLEHLPVGLVLLDLGLPGMHGEEFLEQRSARGLQTKAPVVVITAAGNAETASRVRSLGASLTITKPFNADELVTIAQKFAG
jgi:DNA-binding response OmpR family regulator